MQCVSGTSCPHRGHGGSHGNGHKVNIGISFKCITEGTQISDMTTVL